MFKLKDRMMLLLIGCILFIINCQPKPEIIEQEPVLGPFEENWESLVKHEDPQWFSDAKFGIYTHWGVYSIPAWGHEWYPRKMYIEKDHRRGNYFTHHAETWGDQTKFGYSDFVPLFTAEKFDAQEWADLFKQAGAQFAGPVAEHHDGFAMWDSDLTEWDAMDKGPKRDIVGELATAIRAQDMKFMASLHHARKWWYFEPSFREDHRFDTQNPDLAGPYGMFPPIHEVGDAPTPAYMKAWEEKTIEVIDKYHPDLLWFDSGLERKKFWRESRDDFQAYKKRFLAYYYNESAQRGQDVGVAYKHDDFPAGAGILDFERGRMDSLAPFPWLTDTSIDNVSWSHVENSDYRSVNELIDVLVDIVSKNGCLLLNVGPSADGSIPEGAQQTLLGMGEWLKVNGEAIYDTRPWLKYGEGPTKEIGGAFSERKNKVSYVPQDIRFTANDGVLYVIALGWDDSGQLMINALGESSEHFRPISKVSLLGYEGNLSWENTADHLTVQLPKNQMGQHAFAYKIEFK
ncbi:MAG: alpha-L-fucosidase [Candidatus Marinimicrobia bacterium]|nr:alpha-L-fucosidase [Candidatus Neomarinimicrobiota bacterium]MBT3823623.1 alpha-L-fucosidase [Candidatus Neomarinimicrobiota bacterium]MBT4129518.1 alpha-L-fucosidase [Candidatus Neomarinimicrobiota bacterium]MBT4295956.1 alpha-L-fucosidase [Candidatus Neomarinimicrobiota bacterium]MBT4420042.1 alpha-L-fucosidase [Candidatus Neomarinimicrobiota bacterium]